MTLEERVERLEKELSFRKSAAREGLEHEELIQKWADEGLRVHFMANAPTRVLAYVEHDQFLLTLHRPYTKLPGSGPLYCFTCKFPAPCMYLESLLRAYGMLKKGEDL